MNATDGAQAQKHVMEWGKIIYPGLAALFTALLFWIWGKLAAAPSVLVPSSAVVAFDATECPLGWKKFDEAVGRAIIGTGEARGLTPRSLREAGGEESHVLTVPEMPSHTHPYVDNQYVVSSPLNRDKGGGGTADVSKTTGSAGGDKPHNNMQPYVALLFCRKS